MTNTVLDGRSLSESSLAAKSVREQLRMLETTLRALSSEVAGDSPIAAGRLNRAQMNVERAIDELLCTEATQLPF